MTGKKRLILAVLWGLLMAVPAAGPVLAQETQEAQETTAASPAFSKSEWEVPLGTSTLLKVKNIPKGVQIAEWSSSDADCASVKGGEVKALTHGSAVITAKLSDGSTLRCKVTVPKVKLSKTEITLAKGKTAKISLSGTTAEGSWKSSKKKIAKVEKKGNSVTITAVKYGQADLSVTCGNESWTCHVTVMNPTLNKSSLYLLLGDGYQLKAKKYSGSIKWSSSDTDVVKVSSTGAVQAVGEGTATIKCKANGVTVSCAVTVATARLETDELEMKTGESRTISVSGSAKAGIWSSEDDSIASFDTAGRLTARKSGEVQLTYTVGQSKRTCYVTIEKKDAGKTFGRTPQQRKVGINSLRNASLGTDSRYRFLQGCATDGTYGYFILSDANYQNACAMIKIDLSTWKKVKKKTGLKIHHGNDMTYNSKLKRLVVVHAEGDYKGLSLISPKTLKVKKTVKLDEEVYGVAYSAEKNRYVFGVSGTNRMVIKDSKFQTVGEFNCLRKQNYTRQGIDCDKKYIYILQSHIALGKTRIMVYDWSGSFVTQVCLKGYREGESLFHIGERFVVGSNDSEYSGGQIHETALRYYYQIRYTAGGGKGSMKPKMVKLGKKVKLAKNGFTRSGYKFKGWSLTRNSDGKVLYIKKKGKKLSWRDPKKSYSKYKVYLVKNKEKLEALCTEPGDCITAEAQWKKK